MINIARRQLERNWPFLLAVALVLGGFEFLICAMVSSVNVEEVFTQMAAVLPPLFRAMIEQNMPGGTPAGVLSFGWNHPVAHALLAAVAIALAVQAIAREVESGAIELVLAQPISRARYFTAHAAFGTAALAAVLGAGLLGTALGQAVFSLDAFGAPRFAALFVNGLLQHLAIYAVTLAASAFGREAGRVALVGVLVAVVSYLVNAVATLWSKAEFAKPYSLHHYFDPREVLVNGHLAAASIVTLGAIALAAMVLAFVRFERRDLP
jgi:ABC-2 type transport system permease protein